MSIDDRIRRALQQAIPANPPPDPDALTDELIRRAAGKGPSGTGGAGRAALWIAAVAIVGGLIGGFIGLSGLLDSETEATSAPTVVATTTPVATSTTARPPTTSEAAQTTITTTAPTTTATPPTTAAPTTTAAPATTVTTPAADTTPPSITKQVASPSQIWELDTEGISCGSNPRQSTVTAQVTDDRGVASVTVSWQFQSGTPGSAAMQPSPTALGSYRGTFGPFPYLTVADNGFELVTLTIRAVDNTGNAATAQVDVTVISTATCFI